MKIANSKINTVLILALLLTSTILIVMPIQQAKAQKIVSGDSQPLPSGGAPDHTIATKAYLSFRPNPVGLNQVLLVNMWVNPSTTSGRRLMGFTVTITTPDGTKDVKTTDSYFADSTAWFEYVVDQVGTWKLKFDFPGGYFPAGLVWDYRSSAYLNYTESIYYQPASSSEMTLTVQRTR